MYEIEVMDHFSSAHRLRDQGSACERMHGHNWFVTVTLRSETLDDIGLVIDFKVVKKDLGEILDVLDHQDLNAIPPFDEINPSTENLARHIFEQMAQRLAGAAARVHGVRVSEGPNTAATYYGEA
ncbi:MAG: 6-carboxytetrahydropterin synthase QueD [Deltaproteobacteria bacterium]|nr:6-carboxytetrahydropterin synthase QueD [Deltaproteobacteria bacterium]